MTPSVLHPAPPANRIRRLVLVVLGIALAAPIARLAAGETPSVVPSEGTNGTHLVITLGEDPGPKKPKVFLVPESGKRRRLKVTAPPSGPLLQVEIPKRAKLSAGTYTLSVQPRGKSAPAPSELPAGFEIRLPSDFELSTTVAMPGDELIIRCNHLGQRRGKVFVGDRKAKVKSWKAGLMPGQATEDLLVIKLPKKLTNGDHAIRIRARTGEVLVGESIEITGGKDPDGTPSPNGLFMKFKAQGKQWIDKEPAFALFADDPATPGIAGILGADASHGNQLAGLAIAFDKAATLAAGPVTFTGEEEFYIAYTRGLQSVPVVWSGTGQLVLERRPDGRLAGTFSATLTPQAGATGTVTITQGSLLMDEPPNPF